MKTLLLLLPIMMAGLMVPAVSAQPDGLQQRVPTVTRMVQLFSTLEDELMTAMQKGDSTAIDNMLSDDFELRSGSMPGTPIPRAEWLRNLHGQVATSIEQMAVHDYGTAAIVSYAWKRGASHDIFIVDVWGKSGDTWKLSARYASPAGDRRIHIPGAVPERSASKKMQ